MSTITDLRAMAKECRNARMSPMLFHALEHAADEIERLRAENNRDAVLEEAAVCAERLSDAFANKDFNSVAGGAFAAAVAIRGMKRGGE